MLPAKELADDFRRTGSSAFTKRKSAENKEIVQWMHDNSITTLNRVKDYDKGRELWQSYNSGRIPHGGYGELQTGA
jgi:hypothetical protein